MKLNTFGALVKEGKSLDEAFAFALFVINSKLADLLDENSPGLKDLPVDGSSVRKLAEQIRRDVNHRWHTRDEKPHVEASDLTEIRAELATLREQVTGSRQPHLRVLKKEKI